MNVYRYTDVVEEPITSFLSTRIHKSKFAMLFQWRSETFAFVFGRTATAKEARIMFDYTTDCMAYVLCEEQYEEIKSDLREISLADLSPIDEEEDFVNVPISFFGR